MKGCSVYWWAMGVGTVPAYPPCRGPASWIRARGKTGAGRESRKRGKSEMKPFPRGSPPVLAQNQPEKASKIEEQPHLWVTDSG